MNRDEILRQLAQAFLSFKIHKKFWEEIRDLLASDLNGKEKQFFKSMSTQLMLVKTLGRSVDQGGKHEKLKWFGKDIYSIHVKSGQFNIRFLMSFNESDEPLLLCAFNKRSGKKKTDYANYKGVVEKRLSEMLEEEHNEQ